MSLTPEWAHESPVTLARYQDAYHRAQTAVMDVMMAMLRRAEDRAQRASDAADYWYERATYTPSQISEMQRRRSDEAAIGWWASHECGPDCLIDRVPDPSASWAEARA